MGFMDHPLRICLVHAPGPLGPAFQELGCEVLQLMPPESGVFDLPGALRQHNFAPDMVFQRERLGPRLLLAGLETISAVRVFWALDPHLNAFWQAAYARLFDLTFSTQRRWMPHLQYCGAAVRHLPWYAPAGPFTPFANRPHLAGFVGRLGPTRPARTWLAQLLRTLLPQDFALQDNLAFEPMLDFYRATKLVPNESITGEVNFRLFEAAGCGCVVLAQDLGQEQAELFEPGREMLVCAEALELAEHVRMLAGRPALAEAMGRAAHERAQREHSPLARARSILREAAGAARQAATGQDAWRWLSLALAGLFEADRLDGAGEALAAGLAALNAQDGWRDDPMLLTARLRVAHALGRADELADLLCRAEALPDDKFCDGPGLILALTASASALGLGRPVPAANAAPQAPNIALALAFARRAGVCPPAGHADPAQVLLAWAERLNNAPTPPRAGFSYDARRHLPGSAMECLHSALALSPGNLAALRAAAAHLALAPGTEALRVGLLSDVSLHARDDWRIGLELGLCNLQTFRPGPGLAEIVLAAQTAQTQGEEQLFAEALAQADASGRIRRALAKH